MNIIRIDFLRPQMAHVLKANITELRTIMGKYLGINLGCLRSAEMIVRTRRPSCWSQVNEILQVFQELTGSQVVHRHGRLGLLRVNRHVSRTEEFQGNVPEIRPVSQ